ncbi:MAG: hypothetical protein PHT02_14650 [Tissierellia bacterium]|nr:hypothetical protein [Tissierellia bacterium]
MKLKYEANIPQRIKRYFMGYTTLNEEWWYNLSLNKWENDKSPLYSYCTHAPCNSIKAFRRKLKKAPLGVEFVLVNRYSNHNVKGIGGGINKNLI